MVQYNNMTSPGGVIYSRIAYHFLILLAQKLGTPNSRDSPDVQEKAPGGFDYSLKLVNFKLISTINILSIFYYATKPHWSLVNIDSGNGLVPSGNKPLPKPMLT